MNYAFLAWLFPEQLYKEVSACSKGNMQDAANALQWHLYNGLCQNLGQGIEILNVLPIASYPQYYKRAFVKKRYFDTAYSQNNVSIGFCNVKLIRNSFIRKNITRVLLEWCARSKDNRFVYMYTLLPEFLHAVKTAKARYPDLKVCAVVADLPDMVSLSSKKSLAAKLFERFRSKDASAQLSYIDSFVLLTAQMADYLKLTQPYCVVEGISTAPVCQPEFSFGGKKKTVLYTGTLHKRFGVMNLVEAFKTISGEEYRLILCGVGDSEAEILKAAEEDKRIRFLGQKPRSEILELQREATVLVNPRQNNEEFTKYSFPSKNLEYLSSGRPLVAYKLDGIPDEYDRYIHYVREDSIKALAAKLIEVCEMSPERSEAHCRAAYDFVQTEKNEIAQTRRILEMLSKELL